MALHQGRAVVGVFSEASKAQQAIQALRNAGFTEDQIGVLGRDIRRTTTDGDDTTESYAAEGAATGVAAGAGLGALWGLGILAGVMPVIGPAIAGGALAAVLSSAAAGAAAAGLGGALVGMGIPKDEAEYYESEFQAGRTIVTVTAPNRDNEARSILQRFGAHDRSAAEMSGSTTGFASQHQTIDVPVTREEIVVERTNPRATTGNPGSQEIRVPLRQEEVRVNKQVHDTER